VKQLPPGWKDIIFVNFSLGVDRMCFFKKMFRIPAREELTTVIWMSRKFGVSLVFGKSEVDRTLSHHHFRRRFGMALQR